MTELSDVVAPASSDSPTPISIRRARVISVNGRSVTVDIGGGITIPAVDSCNPIPNQIVYIVVEGTTMTAIASMNGVYKQSTITVISSTATSVTGNLNGTPTAVTKLGGFTVTAGQVIPLLWSADGYSVWAGSPEGQATGAPGSGGGASSGGGGVTSGTAIYAANQGGSYNPPQGRWVSGPVLVPHGAFFFGAGRFKELQGRTITAIRANLVRSTGAGAVTVFGHPHASFPAGDASQAFNAGAVNPTGRINLPVSLAAYLIGGSGTGGLTFTGSGSLRTLPYGGIEIDWRR